MTETAEQQREREAIEDRGARIVWFWEERGGGKWNPCAAPEKPEVKKGRVSTPGGLGCEVRASAKRIAPHHRALDLSTLQQIYGEK